MKEEIYGVDEGFEWFDFMVVVLLYVLGLSWRYVFYYIILDCLKCYFEKWFVVVFFVFILWISVIFYFMVLWVVCMGCIIGIFEVVMGMLVVVVGISILDVFGFIVVAKVGEGDMVVVNVVGSNVFDIWFGFGFFWFIILLIKLGG